MIGPLRIAMSHLREAARVVWFSFAARSTDPAACRIYEEWLRHDDAPPRPSQIAAATRVFNERFVVGVIRDRAELGPDGLDELRADLVGALRRRLEWEGR